MYPYNVLSKLELNQPIEKKILHTQRLNKKNARKHQLKKEKTSKYVKDSIIIDDRLVELILAAIEDKRCCISYYTKLLKMAKLEEEKSIINEIRIDEHKHEKLLNKIYFSITGMHCKGHVKEINLCNNIKKEYKKSIFEELKSTEYYKKLYIGIKSQDIKNILYDLITDEQGHSIKLIYLNSIN